MKIDSFEKNLQELEQIVLELEKGDLNLDNGLKKFEHGVKLNKQCKNYLAQAEKKIGILRENLKIEDVE